jgi:hypothetical protein
MNQLVVTLIVILMPGIIANVICDKITVHSKWSSFKFSLYAFVLGMSCYVSLQVIYYAWDYHNCVSLDEIKYTHLKVWGASVTDNPEIPAIEVVLATIISLPISLLAAYLINHKIFNKIATFFNISTKYGDENLFSYYLNADEIDWIYVRDIERKLTYQGRIVSYSENDLMQEIVMSEVTIYNYEDSAELYSVPTIYLTKPLGVFVIEAIPSELLGEENDG